MRNCRSLVMTLLALVTAASGCATTRSGGGGTEAPATAGRPPSWCSDAKHPRYLQAHYVTGRARAASVDEATSKAKAAVANQVSSKLRSWYKSTDRYRRVGRQKGISRTEIARRVEVISDFRHAELIETPLVRPLRNGSYCVLAVLNRRKAASSFRARLARVRAKLAATKRAFDTALKQLDLPAGWRLAASLGRSLDEADRLSARIRVLGGRGGWWGGASAMRQTVIEAKLGLKSRITWLVHLTGPKGAYLGGLEQLVLQRIRRLGYRAVTLASRFPRVARTQTEPARLGSGSGSRKESFLVVAGKVRVDARKVQYSKSWRVTMAKTWITIRVYNPATGNTMVSFQIGGEKTKDGGNNRGAAIRQSIKYLMRELRKALPVSLERPLRPMG